MFKKIIYSAVALASMVSMTSCNDWLDVKPNNEQTTDDFWKSKEDVEKVLMSSYYYMRQSVPTLLKWGELRGGSLYSTVTSEVKLQDFNLLSTDAMVKYDNIYKIIGAANAVLKYAPGVPAHDNTYYDSRMKADLCEAYFLRAYCNLILLKNYLEFPMILSPYVDDEASFDIAKSTEEEIVAQIKADVRAAEATGAARSAYEIEWQTKGRATKYALYALMADVCLWSEDYATCKEYCDKILNATENSRPAFISNSLFWFDIFNPGNSNEGIFEINWQYTLESANNNFIGLFDVTNYTLNFTPNAMERIKEEIIESMAYTGNNDGRVGRMINNTIVLNSDGTGTYTDATVNAAVRFYMNKYLGSEQVNNMRQSSSKDGNFIIYRVSDILLMKALALAMTNDIPGAFAINNMIRKRAGLPNYNDIDDTNTGAIATITQTEMVEEILDQRWMELLGEGKRWYDLLWYSRINDYQHKDEVIDMIIDGNNSSSDKSNWFRSQLSNPYAWFMPLPQGDIEHNALLVQNPYYN